jgi:hypothetical protein
MVAKPVAIVIRAFKEILRKNNVLCSKYIITIYVYDQPQVRLSVPSSASPFELIKNAAGVS